MAHSLLAHLYSRIRGSQEDVATMALQYLISQAAPLNEGFTALVSSALGVDFGSRLQYACQSVGDNQERPDMVGTDDMGKEVLLCEMKFYAGLTQNQPSTYLDRLVEENGKGLVFVCPKARQTSLWAKLISLCEGRQIEEVNARCVSVDGIRMGILTWADVVDVLKQRAAAMGKYQEDVYQLEGYCAQMDSDAFIPFAPEELSAESAKKIQRLYDVVDEVTNLICSDTKYNAKTKGNASAYKTGYERKVTIDGFSLSLVYDRDLWKSNSSVETPFWVSVNGVEWQKTEEFLGKLKLIPDEKKDTTVWTMCYFALEPLTGATFDEVCQNLKEQALKYLDIFR